MTEFGGGGACIMSPSAQTFLCSQAQGLDWHWELQLQPRPFANAWVILLKAIAVAVISAYICTTWLVATNCRTEDVC